MAAKAKTMAAKAGKTLGDMRLAFTLYVICCCCDKTRGKLTVTRLLNKYVLTSRSRSNLNVSIFGLLNKYVFVGPTMAFVAVGASPPLRNEDELRYLSRTEINCLK